MVTINVKRFGAFIFDLDGVVTQTASLHARAWQQLFDEFLGERARQTGTGFVPFDPKPTIGAMSTASRASTAS